MSITIFSLCYFAKSNAKALLTVKPIKSALRPPGAFMPLSQHRQYLLFYILMYKPRIATLEQETRKYIHKQIKA